MKNTRRKTKPLLLLSRLLTNLSQEFKGGHLTSTAYCTA